MLIQPTGAIVAGDSDLQSLLSNMNQQQLMQLLGNFILINQNQEVAVLSALSSMALGSCTRAFVTNKYNFVLVEGWLLPSLEGNRKSGIALAMHHKICGCTTCGLGGLRQ